MVCAVLCFPIGVILSIVAMVKYIGASGTTAKTLSIVALCVNVLVVVPGVGCLAAISIPNFIKFQCRAKQSEAKSNLKALSVDELSYKSEHETFSSDEKALGFEPLGAKVRYTYAVDRADKDHFHATAHVSPAFLGELSTDAWEVDETGQPKNSTNGCER
ncbi:MAG TPA: hypothetical protein VGO62_14320 [Myxococcota bacterium]